LLKRWRRRRILRRFAIPDTLWEETLADAPVLARLDADERARLRELALLLLHEKRLEPSAGFALDDAMRVRIAALACQPVLNLGLDCYSGFVAIVVYPDEFVIRDRETVDEDGIVHTEDAVLTGEAWEHGPVILSWQDIEASGQGAGYNVVAHEFAHKLDMQSGEANGVPPLHSGMSVTDWRAAFDAAYASLCAELERGEEPWIDPYAAEDPGEFFAVCAELFFDVPEDLAAEYPDIYAELARYFRQDPARRGLSQAAPT
jgi:Mlc titration factor MtfA (ptsG expression regulator)